MCVNKVFTLFPPNFSSFFLLSDLEHALGPRHRRATLKFNCSVSGGLCTSRSGPGATDDWEGRPRHVAKVRLITTYNEKHTKGVIT